MLGRRPLRVVDLGAGTGIFTRLLISLGHDVIPVEPDEGMRAKLRERSPGVEVLAGSAESIPLPAESVDAVTAAQSHHWFDNDAAHAEIARVVRPGGVFTPLWNEEDESLEWVAELGRRARLIERADPAARRADRTDFGTLFAPVEHAAFRHSVSHTAETLLALVQSRSEYLVAREEDRSRITSAVRNLTDQRPEPFELPYITRALKAVRRQHPPDGHRWRR
jgi:SAM-dependent methyltransferase